MIEALQITPTQSQEIGIKKIQEFLKSDEKYFLLEGPAGSGKSSIIRLALERELSMRSNQSIRGTDAKFPYVIGIALSHKAKNNLQKLSIPYVRTFASAYGFKESFLKDGTRVFSPNEFLKEPPVGHLDIPIFVHDEISQYSEMMKQIVLNKTSLFSKVIMMGDRAQLPPIDSKMPKDADSPIFDMELPESCKHTLTERVRQKKGNPILDLSDMIREEIFGNQDLNRIIMEILKPKIHEGNGYVILPEQSMFDTYVKTENYLINKVIAFRNDRIQTVNGNIRKIIFPHTDQKLIVQDMVCLTNNYQHDKPSFKLNNSDEFVIKSTEIQLILPEHSIDEIECYVGGITQDNDNNAFIVTPTEQGIIQYTTNERRLKNIALQNKWLWKDYSAFNSAFTEYTMGYAINAYRCQGSTYENAFVDLNDILTVNPPGGMFTNKRKLQTIYTVITRAKHIVYFIKP